MNGRGDMGSIAGGLAATHTPSSADDRRARKLNEILAGWYMQRTGNADAELLEVLGVKVHPRPSRVHVLPTPPTTADPLLTRAEIETRFGVLRSTVSAWVRTGRVKPIREAGGLLRVRESEVRALLDAGGGSK